MSSTHTQLSRVHGSVASMAFESLFGLCEPGREDASVTSPSSDIAQENTHDGGPLSLRVPPFWELVDNGLAANDALLDERSSKLHRSDGGEPPRLAGDVHARMAALGEPFPLKDTPQDTPADPPPPSSSAQPPPKTPRFT